MRVGIVDDHEVVREGLRAALHFPPDVEVVGEAGSGADALRMVRRTLPDVMLADFRLPDMTGGELCTLIRRGFPSTAVVILTTYLSEDVVQRSFDAGAAGFVTKAAGLEELRRVLDQVSRTGTAVVAGGASALVQSLYQTACQASANPRLTPRQESVLELAAAGCTYPQISKRLHISESTVRFHVHRLKDKLEVSTKAELIARAVSSALITPGSDGSSF